MKITRRSPLTGKATTLDLPICQAQIDAYEGGRLIQHAFANVSSELREFYKSGYTPEDWQRMFQQPVFKAGDHVRMMEGSDLLGVGFIVSHANPEAEEGIEPVFMVQFDGSTDPREVEQPMLFWEDSK